MVNLQIEKRANVNYLLLQNSNKITFSVFIENIGDSSATGVRIRDVLSGNGRIIASSVKVDDCSKNVLLNDMSISVGTIEAGGNSIITYEVEVSKKCAVKYLVNKVIVNYLESGSNICNVFVEESNELVIPIINIDIRMNKTVDKRTAKVGEILNYSILVRNNSNVALENVILSDYVSSDLIVYPSTVLVNGKPQYLDSLNIIEIGEIPSASSVLIQFAAGIKERPETGIIRNAATIKFNYFIVENGVEIVSSGRTCSNEVFTKVTNSTGSCGCQYN